MIQRIKSFLFENRGTRQRIVKNAFWLAMGQIVSRLVRALILIYAARILGAAEYGIFSYALSLAGFFTVFADLGVSTILTREASQKPLEREHYFSTSFSIKSVLLLVSALLVIVGGAHVSKIHDATVLLPFVALLVIMDGIRDFASAYFRAQERMEREALVTVITNVSIAVCGFIILAFSHTARSLTFTYAASAGLGTLGAIFLLKDEFIHLVSNFRRNLVRPILKAALPMTVLGILGVFMLNTDLVMIGWWRSAEEIGWYAAAQRVVQLLYTIPGIFASATFPIFARAVGEGDSKKVRLLMEKGLAVVLGIALPIAVGGIIIGKELTLFLYGPSYVAAAFPFQLLLSTIIFVFPLSLLANYILAYNAQGKSLIAIGSGAAGNIIFNALLIPVWGIAGSAISTIIAQILNVGLLWRIDKKLNDFHTLPHLKKIVLATLAMGAITFALHTLEVHAIVNIIISGIVYGLMLLALKEKLIKEAVAIFKL